MNGAGCRFCLNKREGDIAEYLDSLYINFRHHRIGKERRYFDFYLPDYNLLIERDGEQHYGKSNFFGKDAKSYLNDQIKNDALKTKLAKKNGYKIARIPYWLDNEQVKKEIYNILHGKPTYPDVPDLKQAKTKPLPN